MPRDTNSSFDPQIVRKRQRRLTGIDEIVLSLTAKGLTTGEVAAHFADVYGATVSRDTISRISDKVVGEMTEWCTRPLEPVYPVVFIDAIHVKIRDGQVANRPIYVAIGVTCAGQLRVHQEARTPAAPSTPVAASAARRAASATGRLRNSGVLDSTQYGPVKPARRTA